MALNPGPLNVINNNIELNEEDISSSHFNLDLGVKGLRIRHWNVNNLTTGKFEQIKLYLSGNSHIASLLYREGTLLIVCSGIINLGTALTAQVRTPLPSSHEPSKYDCFTYTFES